MSVLSLRAVSGGKTVERRGSEDPARLQPQVWAISLVGCDEFLERELVQRLIRCVSERVQSSRKRSSGKRRGRVGSRR